jgi:hypothetical protein
MIRLAAILVLSCLGWAQATSNPSSALTGMAGAQAPEVSNSAGNALLPDLPPMPRGKATLVGGLIGNLDRVQDQITVYVFGGQRMKVLFDERTQVYRDGKPASQRDLRNGQRVYLETVLDGPKIFARSIRALTQAPEGECHGQVVSYDRIREELVVRDSLAPEPIKLRLPSTVPVMREGQQVSTDLLPGALVSVHFQPDATGRSVARQVAVLATPGAGFTFVGRVSYLDLHAGRLVLVDPRDNKRYEVSFNPNLRPRGELREGADVTVTAGFDGTQYSASSIVVNQPSAR